MDATVFDLPPLFLECCLVGFSEDEQRTNLMVCCCISFEALELLFFFVALALISPAGHPSGISPPAGLCGRGAINSIYEERCWVL